MKSGSPLENGIFQPLIRYGMTGGLCPLMYCVPSNLQFVPERFQLVSSICPPHMSYTCSTNDKSGDVGGYGVTLTWASWRKCTEALATGKAGFPAPVNVFYIFFKYCVPTYL